MSLTIRHRCGYSVVLVAAVALAACSGTVTPLGPSGTVGSSLASLDQIDPCLASTAIIGEEPPSDQCATGRFTGGGFQINENDLRVSRGFTLHCDALLSNNFEVNWAGGNNFHIDKNPTDVTCQFLSDPNPPAAPVNRIEIRGTGTLNNQPATVHLVLIDNGEKAGAPADQAFIQVNATVLTNGTADNPAPIDGGNIQAHEDQPHKNK